MTSTGLVGIGDKIMRQSVSVCMRVTAGTGPVAITSTGRLTLYVYFCCHMTNTGPVGLVTNNLKTNT